MTWCTYRLAYQLHSPLHVGWRKIGNLMQTRPYITGRVWWGAATSYLVQWLGQHDYREMGAFVRENLIFGYFFVAPTPDTPLLPHWRDGELHYGDLAVGEFECRFLSSLTTTAIDHRSRGAEEGSLHEVEYLVPMADTHRPVYLVGHLFVRLHERIVLIDGEPLIKGLRLFGEVLHEVQLGGERRYGFGRLRLDRGSITKVEDVFGFPIRSAEPLRVAVGEGQALPAHAFVGSLDAHGTMEPLVSLEWDEMRGPGRRPPTLLGCCYSPGATVSANTVCTIGPYGIWQSI